jgi:acetyl-CoA carboxylase biotin carboxyl carrier protein
MADINVDLKKIKELIEVMKQNGLEELEVKQGDDKIYLKRQPQTPPLAPGAVSIPLVERGYAIPASAQGPAVSSPPAAVQPVQKQENLIEIKSPIVGTFYAKPGPDSEPYVEVGSAITPQTIVCIIEAMKVMNEIKADTSGTVAEVLVVNGQAVEYGQVLFKVRPEQ